MTNMNFDLLKDNVLRLMKEKGLKQKQLADSIGMTQPNLNKCLQKGDESRSFTLEQVCKLADYFETSVDDLLGRKVERASLSELEICQFLSTLISHNQIAHFEYKVKERHTLPANLYNEYEGDEIVEVTYNAFYFPNYFHIPSYIEADDPNYEEVRDDILYNGNESEHNMAINNFLERFIRTYEKFDGGKISQEEYKILEDAYYQILKQRKK